jgi:hypothetical protein
MTIKPRLHPLGLSAITSRAGFAIFVAAMFSFQPSHAGEVDSERDEIFGLAFVGSARETGNLKPIPGVQVKAEKGDRRIMARTNTEGVYKLYPNFGDDVGADDVAIACAKDGYEMVDVSRRKLSDAANAPVVAECLMAPKP